MPLFLTSSRFEGLGAWLRERAAGPRVAVVSNASRGLPDAEAIVAPALAALEGAGLTPVRGEVTAGDLRALRSADAIVMTGGDPFRLRADLRAAGADPVLREAFAARVPIAGQSAGAMVCGPTLAPGVVTSPFAPSAGLDLAGLGLTPRLVLPHHDRPGRAALHREAARTWARALPLDVLWDDETLCLEPGLACIRRGAVRTRAATEADAPAVADLHHAAARRAWGPFLGEARLARDRPDPSRWATRIRDAGPRLLVAEDATGLLGFASWGAATERDLPAAGEVRLLYTHPRAWGRGCGRRLLERATWHLLCEGHREAVLWTEQRNARALAVYREGGWRPDGAVRDREHLGAPIRELRHRLDLATHAGGRTG